MEDISMEGQLSGIGIRVASTQNSPPLKVELTDMTASNCSFDSTSLIVVEGATSQIEIENGLISNIQTTSLAPVAQVLNGGTLKLVSSRLFNNFAFEASNFLSERGSLIELTNCTLSGSLSLQSGFMLVTANGQATVRDSTIENNFAYSTRLIEVIDCFKEVLISNTTVTNNQPLTLEEIREEAHSSTCSLLCDLRLD